MLALTLLMSGAPHDASGDLRVGTWLRLCRSVCGTFRGEGPPNEGAGGQTGGGRVVHDTVGLYWLSSMLLWERGVLTCDCGRE